MVRFVAVLIVVVGIAVSAAGLSMFPRVHDGAQQPLQASVTGHEPVVVSMISGSRGARADVELTRVHVRAEHPNAGPVEWSFDRAAALATQSFPPGTELMVYANSEGTEFGLEPSGSDPLRLILVVLGFALASTGGGALYVTRVTTA